MEQFLGAVLQWGTAYYAQCKFGCPVLCQTKEEMINHETSCLRQPFPCPFIKCSWVIQLGSLSAHIYNYHHREVLWKSTAVFHLNFGNDHDHNNYSMIWKYEDGPQRQTFFQVVNDRLFVTFAIGNFLTRQLYVYVQYVDDYSNWKPTGVIEVFRPGGPSNHHWKGRLLPLSYGTTRTIEQLRCLVLNMNNFPRVKQFVIQVRILI